MRNYFIFIIKMENKSGYVKKYACYHIKADKPLKEIIIKKGSFEVDFDFDPKKKAGKILVPKNKVPSTQNSS